MASKRLGPMSAPRVDLDLLRDQADRLAEIQDYLLRADANAEEWHAALEGVLNLLAALRPTSERHSHREKAALAQIEAFRKHLDSDKFKGTELVCSDCETAWQGQRDGFDLTPVCHVCLGVEFNEQRKDWISTANVLRWLGTIKEHLNYDKPAMLDRD